MTTRYHNLLYNAVDKFENISQNACGNKATPARKGNGMYQIKKGVPIPQLKRREGKLYPFSEMERNDCIEVPAGSNVKTTRSSVYAAVRKYQMKNPTKQFTTRVIDGKTVGVWRIK